MFLGVAASWESELPPHSRMTSSEVIDGWECLQWPHSDFKAMA